MKYQLSKKEFVIVFKKCIFFNKSIALWVSNTNINYLENSKIKFGIAVSKKISKKKPLLHKIKRQVYYLLTKKKHFNKKKFCNCVTSGLFETRVSRKCEITFKNVKNKNAYICS